MLSPVPKVQAMKKRTRLLVEENVPDPPVHIHARYTLPIKTCNFDLKTLWFDRFNPNTFIIGIDGIAVP